MIENIIYQIGEQNIISDKELNVIEQDISSKRWNSCEQLLDYLEYEYDVFVY